MFETGGGNDPEIEELEIFGARYKPEGLDVLCKSTNFSKQEIRIMYQGFKQECPSGVVDEESFKEIFAQFFPQGDASQYAHYVFKTFKDFGQNGTLNFEQFLGLLSSLSRGNIMDKLKWIFDLYDINGDGFITKQEMIHIVKAIYDMLGSFTEPAVHEHSAKDHVEKLFYQIDANHDGVISFDEFIAWVQKDENRVKSLFMFDTIL